MHGSLISGCRGVGQKIGLLYETSTIYKLTSGLADYLNFWITGSWDGGLKIGLMLFRGLQKSNM
jgi:hypothetical protein